MRKPVVPRLLGLTGLYSLIFVFLVSVQFTKRDYFSLQAGNMLVQGRYRSLEEGESLPPGWSPLAGEIRVLYGGLEFGLSGDPLDNREGILALLDEAGNRYSCGPEYLVREEGGIRFYLTGGTELMFSAGEGEADLRITGIFGEDRFSGLEIPYRPLKNTRIQDLGDGRALIQAEGRSYRLTRDDAGDRPVLVLRKEGPPIVYGLAEDEKGFRVEDYILPEGEQAGPYREALGRWVDRSYALWDQGAALGGEEDLAAAYLGEALDRGAYRSALSTVSRSLQPNPRRTYRASVYLGDMNTARQHFAALEQEWLTRVTGLVNGDSADVLLEDHVFEYLDRLGQGGLFDRALALIRGLEQVNLEQAPGLLEALTDLRRLRPRLFDEPGAFESPAAGALRILSGALRRSVPEESRPLGLVLAVREGRMETAWNLRLGKALGDWGEAGGDESWAAVGRSIVLSVLALEDGRGRFAEALAMDDQGNILAAAGAASFDGGRLYRLLGLGDYRPKVLTLGPPGLWAWTASPEVRVTQEGGVLDLAVRFPPGETHYLIVRNMGPVYRLQFYGMDWRTDPNFERYDSSGWTYHAQSRTLILKVRHRAGVEHIRLYPGSPPPPRSAPSPGAASEGGTKTLPRFGFSECRASPHTPALPEAKNGRAPQGLRP
jgi:hypothetical protein